MKNRWLQYFMWMFIVCVIHAILDIQLPWWKELIYSLSTFWLGWYIGETRERDMRDEKI